MSQKLKRVHDIRHPALVKDFIQEGDMNQVNLSPEMLNDPILMQQCRNWGYMIIQVGDMLRRVYCKDLSTKIDEAGVPTALANIQTGNVQPDAYSSMPQADMTSQLGMFDLDRSRARTKALLKSLDKHKLVGGKWVPTPGEAGGEAHTVSDYGTQLETEGFRSEGWSASVAPDAAHTHRWGHSDGRGVNVHTDRKGNIVNVTTTGNWEEKPKPRTPFLWQHVVEAGRESMAGASPNHSRRWSRTHKHKLVGGKWVPTAGETVPETRPMPAHDVHVVSSDRWGTQPGHISVNDLFSGFTKVGETTYHPAHTTDIETGDEEIIPGGVYLSWFGLDEQHRGKGLGSKLYGRLEDKFREQGYKNVYLEPANQLARDFWEKQGYVDDESGLLEGAMIKDITKPKKHEEEEIQDPDVESLTKSDITKHKLVSGKWVPTPGEEGGFPSERYGKTEVTFSGNIEEIQRAAIKTGFEKMPLKARNLIKSIIVTEESGKEFKAGGQSFTEGGNWDRNTKTINIVGTNKQSIEHLQNELVPHEVAHAVWHDVLGKSREDVSGSTIAEHYVVNFSTASMKEGGVSEYSKSWLKEDWRPGTNENFAEMTAIMMGDDESKKVNTIFNYPLTYNAWRAIAVKYDIKVPKLPEVKF